MTKLAGSRPKVAVSVKLEKPPAILQAAILNRRLHDLGPPGGLLWLSQQSLE